MLPREGGAEQPLAEPPGNGRLARRAGELEQKRSAKACRPLRQHLDALRCCAASRTARRIVAIPSCSARRQGVLGAGPDPGRPAEMRKVRGTGGVADPVGERGRKKAHGSRQSGRGHRAERRGSGRGARREWREVVVVVVDVGAALELEGRRGSGSSRALRSLALLLCCSHAAAVVCPSPAQHTALARRAHCARPSTHRCASPPPSLNLIIAHLDPSQHAPEAQRAWTRRPRHACSCSTPGASASIVPASCTRALADAQLPRPPSLPLPALSSSPPLFATDVLGSVVRGTLAAARLACSRRRREATLLTLASSRASASSTFPLSPSALRRAPRDDPEARASWWTSASRAALCRASSLTSADSPPPPPSRSPRSRRLRRLAFLYPAVMVPAAFAHRQGSLGSLSRISSRRRLPAPRSCR